MEEEEEEEAISVGGVAEGASEVGVAGAGMARRSPRRSWTSSWTRT